MVWTPLRNMKVNWDYYSQYMGKQTNVPNHQPATIFLYEQMLTDLLIFILAIYLFDPICLALWPHMQTHEPSPNFIQFHHK